MRALVPANSIPIGFYSVLVDNGSEDVAQLDNSFRISVNLPVQPFQQNNTTDIIQARIMNRIGIAPNGLPYDKRIGQVPYDMTAAQAPEFERLYKRLDDLFPQGFAQFMGGALLDLRAEEHGILRRPASFASTVVEISAAVGTVVPVSIRFSTTATPNTTDRPTVFDSVETASVIQKATESGLVYSAMFDEYRKTWVVDPWKRHSSHYLKKGGTWRKVVPM
jgi:hypothetical protein